MKNKKWLTFTIGILLTLIVLAAVGGAGFRIGMMQRNASFTRAADEMRRSPFVNKFDGEHPQIIQGNPREYEGGFQDGRGGPNNQGFNNRGNDRRGGMSFFPPIFGLIRLAVLGLLLWIGYKLVQKSGWRLTRVAASSAPASTPSPSGDEAPSVEVEEKKEEG